MGVKDSLRSYDTKLALILGYNGSSFNGLSVSKVSLLT